MDETIELYKMYWMAYREGNEDNASKILDEFWSSFTRLTYREQEQRQPEFRRIYDYYRYQGKGPEVYNEPATRAHA